MIFSIKSLPAHDGDCFLIRFGEKGEIKNILVDGGRRKKVVKILKEELKAIKEAGEFIDLMILTHIDEDHIWGLLKIFEDPEVDKSIIKKVWFNSKEILSNYFISEEQIDNKLEVLSRKSNDISYKQGISLGKLLLKSGLSTTKLIFSGQQHEIGEGTINVLSPNIEDLEKLFNEWENVFPSKNNDGVPIARRSEEDYNISITDLLSRDTSIDSSVVNGSSIAFCLEVQNVKLLMLADAFPTVVGANLERIYSRNGKIPINLVKVSHHGSKHNTNKELLNLIDCKNYLLSTNGSSHGLPNKETLVKIASSSFSKDSKTVFYFNYPNIYKKIFSEEEMNCLNITCYDNENIKDEILEVNLWNYLEN